MELRGYFSICVVMHSGPVQNPKQARVSEATKEGQESYKWPF